MVGRKQEIKTLDEVMSRNQGQLVAVYRLSGSDPNGGVRVVGLREIMV